LHRIATRVTSMVTFVSEYPGADYAEFVPLSLSPVVCRVLRQPGGNPVRSTWPSVDATNRAAMAIPTTVPSSDGTEWAAKICSLK